MSEASQRIALVLSGGGARAAYQVGVLKAVAELLPEYKTSPFPIICGTSAGAINATVLACSASRFKIGVKRLEQVWGGFTSGQIYRSDFLGMTANSMRWLANLFRKRQPDVPTPSLLDNAPLRDLLKVVVPFNEIAKAINKGDLYAISVTCSGYSSGESISFFEAHSEVESWHRYRRAGARTRIQLQHLIASSAIPMVFPAVKINREYFGDGSVRFMAPISPALHLGADKVFIVGVDPVRNADKSRVADRGYPTIAEIAGHVMDSVFLDSLDSDMERLKRINNTLSKFTDEERRERGITLKPVDTLVIAPSKDLSDLSGKHGRALPRVARFFFRRIGITSKTGSTILSYLLFEGPYTRELIDLGYQDAMHQKAEIRRFFGLHDSHLETTTP
ncbi:patatin-like phospholipase family protein [Permianibacter aggregans]|uniref:NTE family protein n=1 Tax=Permianibacter aggregans TaxID=1510150 RepID=A0A4R6UTE4_9GAMM|nr:patatin-like phospholipase family protein [Permianibacter aggregans]QGX38719.1 patatin-like phospholipase family protein [Permianibacter aggregans]TDQ50520.1 NTE family protein [Permianibacter aggregans]